MPSAPRSVVKTLKLSDLSISSMDCVVAGSSSISNTRMSLSRCVAAALGVRGRNLGAAVKNVHPPPFFGPYGKPQLVEPELLNDNNARNRPFVYTDNTC